MPSNPDQSGQAQSVFGYWAIRGRGQHIRAFLAYVKEDSEYREYAQDTYKDWFLQDKPGLNHPLSNLPYWKEENFTLFQSNAILRYLATKHKLAGNSRKEIATCDMIAEFFEDIRAAHIQLVYRTDKDLYPEKRTAYLRDWRENKLPAISRLLSDKDFLLGSSLTYPDFILHELLHVHAIFDEETDLQKQAPNLAAFMARFEAIPAIADFQKREIPRGLPVYARFCNWPGEPPILRCWS